MRFPSIAQLQNDGISSAIRFPLSLLFGFLAAGLGCWMLEIDPVEDLRLLNLLLTFALGIPLYFCIDILAEKKNFTPFHRQISWIIGLVILGLIYFSFPSENTFANTRVPYIRYTIYNLAIHLMVAFLPYFGSDNQEGFWNYNKNLFIRLVLGVYYSLVIFIGLSLALLAINALFEANIQGETYPQIFTITFGVFNTWFFLAGIPKTFDNKLTQDDYPKGLKIFTQFILIPLLLIYLCILYFYGAKILITGDWPKGIVTYMIIAISVLGIFTNLLLYPYQQWKESGWIKKFHRAYYICLIPLVVLLFLAIGIRIQDYGLTVNRYIITLMGIWLAFISVYYTLGKKNIKTIPISLALFMILSSFGPWGMFSLGESMQRSRLSKILTENNILVNYKIRNPVKWEIGKNGNLKPIGQLHTNSLPREELNEVNSILQYLADYHGMETIYPWFDQDLKSLMRQSKDEQVNSNYLIPSKLLVESMGLTYVPYYEMLNESNSLKEMTLVTNDYYQLEISEFDYLRRFNIGTWVSAEEESFSYRKYHLEVEENKTKLILKWADGQTDFDISKELKDLFNLYGGGYHNVPSEEFFFLINQDGLEIKIQINSLTMTNSEGTLVLQNLEGLLLVNEIQEE
ncbi:DUF4153 domain-containing protein [Algoriphagus sp. D3-2-R+10]|uniref:DUF4153 domain-containing protein n=1 Tax=Algoriphagus aurantiacus TaxID=3103948 RepID=UPI002B3BA9B4|nr:DUF4153 domain-containing protein [Algoriphagus sp. D3-2-R+10]MEB2775595.1 DUF4153 domain-containing protein [Algoriphagus sp. D3-2-R+10]